MKNKDKRHICYYNAKKETIRKRTFDENVFGVSGVRCNVCRNKLSLSFKEEKKDEIANALNVLSRAR